MTLGNDDRVWRPVLGLLLASRETAVNYMMPLGLAGIFAHGHHYGPGPWDHEGSRPDWTSLYYHRADAAGLGFERTAAGSNALAQYAPQVAAKFADLDHCPEEFLAWFHHVPWDRRMSSGRTLWDELCHRYTRGVDTVRGWQRTWETLAPFIDAARALLSAVDTFGMQARNVGRKLVGTLDIGMIGHTPVSASARISAFKFRARIKCSRTAMS